MKDFRLLGPFTLDNDDPARTIDDILRALRDMQKKRNTKSDDNSSKSDNSSKHDTSQYDTSIQRLRPPRLTPPEELTVAELDRIMRGYEMLFGDYAQPAKAKTAKAEPVKAEPDARSLVYDALKKYGGAAVAKAASKKYGDKLDPTKRSEKVASFEQDLADKVIGQPEAVGTLVQAYQTFTSGLNPIGRPVAVLLFAGATGTGKTRVVEAAAEVLLGSPQAITKIDCAEFSQPHEVAKLLGCFVLGTKVLMADGSRKPIEAVRVGDKVLTKYGTPQEVIQTYEYQANGILSIKVAGCSIPLEVTPNHLIWAIRGSEKRGTTKAARTKTNIYNPDKLEYIPAGELKAGDITVYPRFKPDAAKYHEYIDLADTLQDRSRIKVSAVDVKSATTILPRFLETRKMARIIGYYIADGGVLHDSNGIHFTMGERKNAAVEDLIYEFMDCMPTASLGVDEGRPNAVRIVAHSGALGDCFATLFGSSPQTKRLPEWFMHAPDDVIWDFLDAAFMGDGGRSVTRRLDYSTSSETLASQMELLIRRLGYITQMQRHEPAKPEWSARYRLYVSGHQITSFLSKLRLTGATVKLGSDVPAGIQRNSFVDDNYIYQKITGIDRLPYAGPVYDFSVNSVQSYIANATCSHNSPPGYLGHKETVPLLSQKQIDQYCKKDGPAINFILFDEIEKANETLWNLLLGITDKGVLTIGDNTKTDFSRTVLVMTTNLGARDMERQRSGVGNVGFTQQEVTNDSLSETAMAAIKRRFSPEFINRLDKIIVFNALTHEDYKKIAELELRAIQNRILTATVVPAFVLRWTDSLLEFLLKHGIDERYGARELKRCVEQHIVLPLANLVSDGQISVTDIVTVDTDKYGPTFHREKYARPASDD